MPGKITASFGAFLSAPAVYAEAFSFPLQGSIAFHGTADPWAETDSVQALAAQKEVPLFLTKNANHSLETGDVQTDLSILKTTMDRVERFIINP